MLPQNLHSGLRNKCRSRVTGIKFDLVAPQQLYLINLRGLWSPPADRHKDGVGVGSRRGGGCTASHSHGSGLSLSTPWTLEFVKPATNNWSLWSTCSNSQFRLCANFTKILTDWAPKLQWGSLNRRNIVDCSPQRYRRWSPEFFQAEPWRNRPKPCWLRDWTGHPASGRTPDEPDSQSVIPPVSRCSMHPSSGQSVES